MLQTAETLFTAIDAQQEQMLKLLETIVNIDSGSFYKPGIDQVIRILKAQFDALGMATTVVDLAERGNHLIARKVGTAGPALLLVGHCDTVFDTGTVATRPFRIEDGRAYGPGVVDMKGGLTAIVFALGALRTYAPETWAALTLTVVVNSDEEISSGSSRAIIEAEARKADAICVLEPARPGGEYVTQRKGSGTFTLRVQGINAHAGMNPELGASAIHELISKLSQIQALNNAHPGLTINIGTIQGGTRPNVVADAAEAEIDVRTQTTADSAWIADQIQAIVAVTGIPRTQSEVSGGISFPPMPRTDQNLKLFDLVHQAGAELGLDLKHVSTGGASDANYASQFAPTCDGMGPQGGRQHSPDEYMIVATLPERTKVLARFITLWTADQMSIRAST